MPSTTPPPTRPALVGLAVYAVDLDRLVAFYRGVLDLAEVERGPGFVTLADTSCELSVVAIPAEIAAGLTVGSPPRPQEDAALKPVFVVASLAEVAVRAAELGGGTRDQDSAWTFRGLRRLDGFDPEGNVVQFAEVV